MGAELIHRPDWAPAVAADTTIAGGVLGSDWSTPVAANIPPDLSSALASRWAQAGGVAHHLDIAQRAADNVLSNFSTPEKFTAMVAGFDNLPAPVRETILEELALGAAGGSRNASAAEVAEFTALGFAALVQHWRGGAARKVSIAKMRFDRWYDSLDWLSETDLEAAYACWDDLSGEQVYARA
jgi:hypothetical protein